MYHTIIVVGRLGRDPEMRYSPAGEAVTSFSIASDRRYTQNGEQVKETTWFRVSVWGKMAEASNTYLSKGKMVLVEGRLMVDRKTGGPRIWDGKNGEARAAFEITASAVRFLSSKSEAREEDAGAEFSETDDGEIPF